MHLPVLLNETISYLNAKNGGKFIDATIGLGGHTLGILKANKSTRVLGLDVDQEAVVRAKNILQQEGLLGRAIVVHADYENVDKVSYEYKFQKAQGIIIDLGLSSVQLDDKERGFSFQTKGLLDMRFNKSQKLHAGTVVNTYPVEQLKSIFIDYGEETKAGIIAKVIDKKRKIKHIYDTAELFQIIRSCFRDRDLEKAKNAARRIFQAIRIEVNKELIKLNVFLPKALDLLDKDGRIVTLSFHSLEDRIIKNFFKTESATCVCPSNFPVCVCAHKPRLKVLTKKPVVAGTKEIAFNPRSKSAKLRAAQKI